MNTATQKTNVVVPLTLGIEPTLFDRFAAKYNIARGHVVQTLRETALAQYDEHEVSDADIENFVRISLTYNLNPLSREIYLIADFGRVSAVVSVDGWSKIINDNQNFDGMDFSYSDELIESHNQRAQPCEAWIECHIHRKDRAHPVVVREYLSENYLDTLSWNGKTRRLLRHKAVIQCARYAFSLSGISDQEEINHEAHVRRMAEKSGKADKTAPEQVPSSFGGLGQAKMDTDDVVSEPTQKIIAVQEPAQNVEVDCWASTSNDAAGKAESVWFDKPADKAASADTVASGEPLFSE